MSDQRQPDQPIDRNRDIDRSQSSDSRNERLQGSQPDRQNQQGLQGSRSDRQNQSSQAGSNMSGRDQEIGLDMSRQERSSSGQSNQQDRMQTRQAQGQQEDGGRNDVTRGRTANNDEMLDRPYDTDDMEAMGTGELDDEGSGDSRRGNQEDIGRNH